MMFTVLGAGGFIGSQLVRVLKSSYKDIIVYAPLCKNGNDVFDEILKQHLGHVFYCIGLTANFRTRPLDTVEAHVCLLRRLLYEGRFDSLTYLSSTRIYEGVSVTHETTTLQASPLNPEHIYNISKLMGESLCLTTGLKTKIVRISNVFGQAMPSHNFISQILNDAVNTGRVRFLTAEKSSKDYVSIADVARWLPQVALHGKHSIYNIASGRNTSNAEIALSLEKRGINVEFEKDAYEWSFPVIDVSRLNQEFGGIQCNFLDELDNLFLAQKEVISGRIR